MNFILTNLVDLIIVLVFLFFIFEGTRVGFWIMLADALSFLASLFIALTFYSRLTPSLIANFSIGKTYANALSFLLLAILSEAILGFFLARLLGKLPKKIKKLKNDRFWSIFPSLLEGAILASFILTLLLGFPISPKAKSDIVGSKIGGFLVEKTTKFEVSLTEIFGGIAEESLTYFTVRPGSTETIPLEIKVGSLTVDQRSEEQMVELINKERKERGISELTRREDTLLVARGHASDMWERKYFGHFSPEGEDVGDRLEKGSVNYSFAGENLALAPTAQTAHTGLMGSEGHRKNILETRFKTVSVGVIDNGVYGKMFVQIFTD